MQTTTSSEHSIFKRAEQFSSRRQGVDQFDISILVKCDHNNETIEELIKNPIKCGYLLAFCQHEFSTENMKYIMEIDRFKDTMKRDSHCWNQNLDYKDLDALLRNHIVDGTGIDAHLPEEDVKRIIAGEDLVVGKESLWPSKKIHFEPVFRDIEKIWDSYLSPNAPNQICMPSKVLINTKHRLENLHLYGGSVFDETLIDPIKTLAKDTLPRFLASKFNHRMILHLQAITPLPDAKSLYLHLPSKAQTAKWDEERITEENIFRIKIADMLHDSVLYEHFNNYCKSIFSDENILCARAISIFKCHFKNQNDCPPSAEEMMWKIFRYFAAPGSAYEISLSFRRRKMLMQHLAVPTFDMFDTIEESIHQILRVHWGNFAETQAFKSLPSTLIAIKQREMMLEESKLFNLKDHSAFNSLKMDIMAKKKEKKSTSPLTSPTLLNPLNLVSYLFSPRNSPIHCRVSPTEEVNPAS